MLLSLQFGGDFIKRVFVLGLVIAVAVSSLVVSASASDVYTFWPYEVPSVYSDFDFADFGDGETFFCESVVPEGRYELIGTILHPDGFAAFESVGSFVVSYSPYSDLEVYSDELMFSCVNPDGTMETIILRLAVGVSDNLTLLVLSSVEDYESLPADLFDSLQLISVEDDLVDAAVPFLADLVSADMLSYLLHQLVGCLPIILPACVCFLGIRKGLSWLFTVLHHV